MPPVESENQNFSSNDGGIERGGAAGANENPWRDDLREIYGPSGDKPGSLNGSTGERPDDKSQKEQLGPGQGGEQRWADASGRGSGVSDAKPEKGNVNGEVSDNNSAAQKGKDVVDGANSEKNDKLNGFAESVKKGVEEFKKGEGPADSGMGNMSDHQEAQKEGIRTPDGSANDGPAAGKDDNKNPLATGKDMDNYKQPDIKMQENGMQPVDTKDPAKKVDGVSSNQAAGDADAQQQGFKAKESSDVSTSPRGIKTGLPATQSELRLNPDGSMSGEMVQPQAEIQGRTGNDNLREPDVSAPSAQEKEPVLIGDSGSAVMRQLEHLNKSKPAKDGGEVRQNYNLTNDMKKLLGKEGWQEIGFPNNKDKKLK